MPFCKLIPSVVIVLISYNTLYADEVHRLAGNGITSIIDDSDIFGFVTDRESVRCLAPDCKKIEVVDKYNELPIPSIYICKMPKNLDDSVANPELNISLLGKDYEFLSPFFEIICSESFYVISNEEGIWSVTKSGGLVKHLSESEGGMGSPYNFINVPEFDIVVVGEIGGSFVTVDYSDTDNLLVGRGTEPRLGFLDSSAVAFKGDDDEINIIYAGNTGWNILNTLSGETTTCADSDKFFVNNNRPFILNEGIPYKPVNFLSLCSNDEAGKEDFSDISTSEYHRYFSSYSIPDTGDSVEICYFSDQICETYQSNVNLRGFQNLHSVFRTKESRLIFGNDRKSLNLVVIEDK